jgi:hypothetical protein
MQRVELFQTLIRIFGLSDMTEDLESASRKSAGQDRPTWHESERMLRLAASKDSQLSRMLNFCGDNALIMFSQSLNVTHLDVAIANAQH